VDVVAIEADLIISVGVKKLYDSITKMLGGASVAHPQSVFDEFLGKTYPVHLFLINY
jgi:hypothetical protein